MLNAGMSKFLHSLGQTEEFYLFFQIRFKMQLPMGYHAHYLSALFHFYSHLPLSVFGFTVAEFLISKFSVCIFHSYAAW
jgi:hypothetical protein